MLWEGERLLVLGLGARKRQVNRWGAAVLITVYVIYVIALYT